MAEFCNDCTADTSITNCTVQEHWDKRLKVGPDKGTSRFLCYGYNNHWKDTPKEQSHKLIHEPRTWKPSPRAVARAAVHGTPLPSPPDVTERPVWGFAGGYGPEGRLIKANPGTIRRQKIQEEKDCSQIAITPRRK